MKTYAMSTSLPQKTSIECQLLCLCMDDSFTFLLYLVNLEILKQPVYLYELNIMLNEANNIYEEILTCCESNFAFLLFIAVIYYSTL